MRTIWINHPITASEVIDSLRAKDANWHPKTVRTLLARLVKKKALGYTSKGNMYFYEPLVTERECVANASASFLDRVFGGALTPMVAHFVEKQRLSEAELEELRALLRSTTADASKTGRKKR